MIKKYKQFLEAISGTMDTMPFGPGMPRQELRISLTSKDTQVIYTDITGEFYTTNDYNDLYGEYLKKGGKPLTDGFTKENLEKVLTI